MKNIAYHLLAIACFISCGHSGNDYQYLERVDSMLAQEQTDSALYLIEHFNPAHLNEELTAFYRLLFVQSRYKAYRPTYSDSIINLAIDYYENHGNSDLLARCYFYKGGILLDLDKKVQALDNLKMAEKLVTTSSNYTLRHKIYYLLSFINANYQEKKVALKYALKALECSKISQRPDHMAYDYGLLLRLYNSSLEEKDSCLYYCDLAIKMIDMIPASPPINRAQIWGNIGVAFSSIDSDKAVQFLEEANSLVPQDNVYGQLADINLSKGDTVIAKRQLYEGFSISKNLQFKTKIAERIGKIAQETGNYREATEWMQKAQKLKDSLMHQQQKDNILAQQMAFDGAVKQERASTKLMYALLAIGVAALAGIVAFWFLRRKTTKDRQELKTANRRLRSASKKLNKLEQERKEEKKEQRRLEKTLENGHILYTELLSGGNVNCWKKKEIVELMVYYRHNNPSFNEEIEQEHKNLTPRQILYLILKDMGRSQQDIIQTMGLSTGAFNTMCSRMKTR